MKQLRTSGNCVASFVPHQATVWTILLKIAMFASYRCSWDKGASGGTIASFLQEPSSQARYPHIRFIGALHGKLVSLGPRRIGWLVGLSIENLAIWGPAPWVSISEGGLVSKWRFACQGIF